MSCETLWNIILSVLSLILAAVSVWIALSTLRQNSRMIEETTRPSLSLLILSETELLFVIKNYGKSDAIIESVSHNMIFSGVGGYYPFKDCEGVVIPPGEYIQYVENYKTFCESNEDTIHVRIEYSSNIGKKYVIDQDYSILALRNQTHMETSVDSENAAVIQAKCIQKISKLSRLK